MVGTTTAEVLAEPAGPTSISDTIFLIPNGTFLYELILFAVFFFIFAKFVVPPIRKAMAEREERVRQTQRDNEEADERFAAAKQRHDEVLAEARSSASSIREEARTAARTHVEEVRGEAEQEVATRRDEGERELAGQRSRVSAQVSEQLPTLAGTLAEKILGRPLSDSDRKRSITNDYLQSIGSSGSTGPRASATSGAPAGAEES